MILLRAGRDLVQPTAIQVTFSLLHHSYKVSPESNRVKPPPVHLLSPCFLNSHVNSHTLCCFDTAIYMNGLTQVQELWVLQILLNDYFHQP